MSVQKHVNLVIIGKVQGVGYRYSLKLRAESLGITGYVMNQDDGSVFVTAQGEATAVENFVKWCYRGPPTDHVRGIKKESGTLEPFHGFSIRY